MFARILKGAPLGNDNASKEHEKKKKPNPNYTVKSISGEDYIKNMIKYEGWRLDRVKGSHHYMVKEGYESFPVVVHKGKDLSIGVLKEGNKKCQTPLDKTKYK